MKFALPILIGSLLLIAGCARAKTENPSAWRAAMQPPLDAQLAGALASGPDFREVIQLAAERNPGVEARRREWLAMIHAEPQALALPDPRVNELTYNFTMEIWESIQIMQDLPWPQKIWTSGKIAATDGDIARLQYEIALRDLVIEVKNAWYELYYLDQAASITAQIETIFRNQSQLAYQQIGTGTQLSEAFRADSQAAQLAYDRILLAEQRAAQAETLKALLNLPPQTVIGPVRAAPAYRVSPEIDDLYQRAENYSQLLKIRGLSAQRARHETHLARLARIPDLSPELMIEGLEQPDKVYLGMLSANLPIWEYRNRALVREKKAAEEAARLMAMEETNRTRRAVAQAYFQSRLAERLIALYAGTLLPQADSVMRQAEIDYRAGIVSFSSVLETTLAYHNFLLAWHRAVADRGKAIGAVERVLGTTAEARVAETAVTP